MEEIKKQLGIARSITVEGYQGNIWTQRQPRRRFV